MRSVALPNGLHPAAAAEAVAHPEDVGEVHPAVVEGLEDAEEFEVAADALGAVREMAGRQPPLAPSHPSPRRPDGAGCDGC